jgi:alpha-tubulin suppressor-like RCC1 family protein
LHTAAVRQNGTLWTWGLNSEIGSFPALPRRLLGDNTSIDRSSPVSVVGGFTDWCQVSVGSYHTTAVRTNGTLWSWGYASLGRLGNNTTTDSSSPVSVVGGFTDWCQVSSGGNHTAAIRQNGTLWAWGNNDDSAFTTDAEGALGDGTTVPKSSPVSVIGGLTNWCQVSAGKGFTTALAFPLKGFI